jgi:dTDP-4-amino-4,6-dideoxygalactose transaminase
MPEPIPFLRLGDDYAEVQDDVARRFRDVLDSQVFVLGPQTQELERSFATRTGARHAIACGSGTDALSLALAAHRIGPGDAVIVPTMTFVATGTAVVRAGATPVFADIDPATLNLGADELCGCVERLFERNGDSWRLRNGGAVLRAVLPVHLFGRVVDMEKLGESASNLGAILIEDAAQAVDAAGAERVGAWGDAGCFSFYPTKNFGGAGDAGMVTTNDASTAERLRSLRVHGVSAVPDEFSDVGLNARIDELQAAYLNAKLPRLAAWTAMRGRLAARYDEKLGVAAERGTIALPGGLHPPAHVYHQYAVRIAGAGAGRERDRVAAVLEAEGIDTRVFYRVPLHRQPCFDGLATSVDCPAADRAAGELLSLPIYPSLEEAAVDRIADAVCGALS